MNNINPLYYIEEKSLINKLSAGFGKNTKFRNGVAAFRKGFDKAQKKAAEGLDKLVDNGTVKKAGKKTGEIMKSIKDKREARRKASQFLIKRQKNAHNAVKLGVLTQAER